MAEKAGFKHFSIELATELCSRLIDQSLRKVCQAKDMPTKSTALKWLAEGSAVGAPADKAEYVRMYTLALQARADAAVEEIIEIADECALNREALQKADLRIKTRLSAAENLSPKKYGKRAELTLTTPNPLTVIVQRAEGWAPPSTTRGS